MRSRLGKIEEDDKECWESFVSLGCERGVTISASPLASSFEHRRELQASVDGVRVGSGVGGGGGGGWI